MHLRARLAECHRRELSLACLHRDDRPSRPASPLAQRIRSAPDLRVRLPCATRDCPSRSVAQLAPAATYSIGVLEGEGVAGSVLGLRDWLPPSAQSRLVGVPAARIREERAPPSARLVRTAVAKRATRLTCRPMPTTKCILCGQRLAPPSLSLITASPDPRLCASCHALPEAERQKLRQAAQVRVLREDENE